jgi:hypothetical protein
VSRPREGKPRQGDPRHRTAGGASDHANIDPFNRAARERGWQWLWRMVVCSAEMTFEAILAAARPFS